MVSASAFADVMIKKRKYQSPIILQRYHQLRTHGQFMRIFTVSEISEVADREQRVLIYGVGVEKIVLHLTDYFLETRQQPSKHTPVIHLIERMPDAAAALNDF